MDREEIIKRLKNAKGWQVILHPPQQRELINFLQTSAEVVGEKELADKFKKLYTAIDKYAEDKINSTIKRILG